MNLLNALVLASFCLLCSALADEGRPGIPLEWFTVIDNDGGNLKYCIQKEQDGKLKLSPSNGFFNKGIKAQGESSQPFTESNLISKNFAYHYRRFSQNDFQRRCI